MGQCFGKPVGLGHDGGDAFQCFIWKVHTNIYVSGYEGAKDFHALKRLGITHILNLVGEGLYSMPEVGPVEETYFPDHFVYKHITSTDTTSQDLRQFFRQTSPFIELGCKKGAVLVHCWAGISRSVSCICAYLMDHEQYTFHEALNHIRVGRPLANPNEGFRKQLELYEQDLMSQGRIRPKANVPFPPHFAVNYADNKKVVYGQTPGSEQLMQQQQQQQMQQQLQQQMQQSFAAQPQWGHAAAVAPAPPQPRPVAPQFAFGATAQPTYAGFSSAVPEEEAYDYYAQAYSLPQDGAQEMFAAGAQQWGAQAMSQQIWPSPAALRQPPKPAAPAGWSSGGGAARPLVPDDCVVYVCPCPPYWDETKLVEMFQAFGKVVSGTIVTDRNTGQRKGFAFVNFATSEAAHAAAASMNGMQVDSMNRLQVNVKQSKPRAAPY
eukprot:Tamp_13412.p1 GENE.Tamp_13412~~Tamp_13412.p1  ORF type:complete len:435 (-),score=91.89 Tamp_13412:248-1552(-)